MYCNIKNMESIENIVSMEKGNVLKELSYIEWDKRDTELQIESLKQQLEKLNQYKILVDNRLEFINNNNVKTILTITVHKPIKYNTWRGTTRNRTSYFIDIAVVNLDNDNNVLEILYSKKLNFSERGKVKKEIIEN